MERTLGVMCGAGVLPARMAAAARRHGWRIVAFTFGEAPGVDAHADLTIPSRFTEITPVLAALAHERATAALFCGKFWLGDVLRADGGDVAARSIATEAGSLTDRELGDTVVATLAALGIEVLDQRTFVGDWLAEDGCSTSRTPTEVEWRDVRRGAELARLCADARVGQTVVVKRGVVAAVEAIEGTTAAIRRGTALAGPGAVVVKAAGRGNDYRFDVPTIGTETIEAAAAGGVTVVAVETGRVMLLERDAVVARADAAGVAVVGVNADAAGAAA